MDEVKCAYCGQPPYDKSDDDFVKNACDSCLDRAVDSQLDALNHDYDVGAIPLNESDAS